MRLVPVRVEQIGEREVVFAEEWTVPSMIAWLLGAKSESREVRLVRPWVGYCYINLETRKQISGDDSDRVTEFVVAERIRKEIEAAPAKPASK